MKKTIIIIAIAAICPLAQALDGHNGIKFDMTQPQVEAKGFICNQETKSESTVIATCRHMDMTGAAFSVPTQNYEVGIGLNKRVASIRADLVGIRSREDYLGLLTKVSQFFPTKDEKISWSAKGVSQDFWRDKNNAGISIFYSSGVRGIIKDTMAVTFYSPADMAASDKLRAKSEAKEAAEKKASIQPGEPNASKQDALPKE